MKKVLIITYYWPPAGGPGVQRILKFAKYFPQFGWQPLILTVSEGEYPARDDSMLTEIPEEAKIFKTRSLEPNQFYKSFVGMHQVPIVHGLTIGEFATMINGEGWLENNLWCDLSVIPCKNYTHKSFYSLPVNPSPNLKSMRAVYLYPSLGLFEGTIMNVGRGTDFPFEVIGHPGYPDTTFSYKPQSNVGATNPKHKDIMCYGVDLRNIRIDDLRIADKINLQWVVECYNSMNVGKDFFINYFTNLTGNTKLKLQIIQGLKADQIRESWQSGIEEYKKIRKKYLLYPDFE